MLFTVVLSFFMVIFSKINGCPSQEQRPCTTPNGTRGSCIQFRYCFGIPKLNGGNLSPDELDFFRRSVCGIDLDRSKLFCCDNNQIRRAQDTVVNRQDNVNSLVVRPISQKRPDTVDDLIQVNVYPSTPVLYTSPTTTTTTTKPTSEAAVVYCRTPNGERGQCISIYQCAILKSSIVSSNTTENQKRFLKESVCGFDATEKPLVCCGSDANFNENVADGSAFRINPFVPVGYCGIQGSETEQQTKVPELAQRFFKSTQSMNFTLPNRIFGGENSNINEFPWTVLLAYETNDGKKIFACGGSLISSRYVLTAAHCVSGRNVGEFANKLSGVRLGEWDYGNKGRDCITTDGLTECNDGEINVGVESIHSHPGYRFQSREKYHDIALLRLNKDVKFTKSIRPICLPNIDDYISPGEKLTISGWGLINYNEETTIQQKVEVPAVSKSQCSLMFEKSSRLTQMGRGQFCAGGEPGKDACIGDSGAPLMKKIKANSSDTSVWYIEGIVSFGTGCGLSNQYGVYTKVSEYLGWIHSTILA